MSKQQFLEFQSLDLRVRKISPPSLFQDYPLVCQNEDILGTVLPLTKPGAYQNVDQIAEGEVAQGTTNYLTFTPNLRNVYVGEKFFCCVSITNNFIKEIRGVGITVKVTVGTTSQTVFTTMNKRKDIILPNNSYNHLVPIRPEKNGKNILSVIVKYHFQRENETTFSKDLTYSVISPIHVKASTTILNSKIFLQTHLQNITKKVVCLNEVKFESINCFNVIDCNNIEMNNNEKNQTFSGKMHLCFKDQRKYLFQITPKEGFEEKAKRVTTIGKIIVNWQTKISSSKKIHTTNVPIKIPVRPEIEITIDKIPEDVILEQVFEVECRILNRTNDKLPLRLSYQYEKMKGILINGLSGVDLGEIEPFKPEIITIKMFPIFPGIQEIKGIVITNLITKQNFTIISPIKLVVKKN